MFIRPQTVIQWNKIWTSMRPIICRYKARYMDFKPLLGGFCLVLEQYLVGKSNALQRREDCSTALPRLLKHCAGKFLPQF